MDNISGLRENGSFDFNFDQFRRPNGPNKKTETSLKMTLYCLACIGNVLLLFIVYKDPLKRFRNLPSYFISNLTMADLLSILSGMCDSAFQLNPEESGLRSQEIAGCLAGIGIQGSFLIIMIFAIDRYMAIVHPYRYKNVMTRKAVLITLILFPWCFAIIALPVIYFAPAYQHGRTLTNWFAGNIIALTAITLIVHPLTHWSFKKKAKELSTSSYMDKLILEENLKIAKTLATTVLMVSVCLIVFMSPYLVAFSFSLSGCNKCFLNHAFQSFWKYYPLLTSVRLMTNSLVYAWRLPLYRKSLKVVIFHDRLRPTSKIHNSPVNGPDATVDVNKAADHVISINSSQRKVSPKQNNKNIFMRTYSNLSSGLKDVGIENHTINSHKTSHDGNFQD